MSTYFGVGHLELRWFSISSTDTILFYFGEKGLICSLTCRLRGSKVASDCRLAADAEAHWESGKGRWR